MTISAWYMDSNESDQRLPHQQQPPKPVSVDLLSSLGVLHWSGITGGEEDPTLAKIRADRGYTYSDVVNVCPEKLPNYEGNFSFTCAQLRFYLLFQRKFEIFI